MTKRRNWNVPTKIIRNLNQEAIYWAANILAAEVKLIPVLQEMDRNRYYVRFGYKSLRGYCTKALLLSESQSQRIVTQVRRTIPSSKIGTETTNKLVRAAD